MSSKMIKDPIHGAIRFEGEAELLLKNILSEPFFQRLRRIKQLGFSDHVFPSATHSRFAHSLGVYSVAKRMLSVIEPGVTDGNWSRKGRACLAAALLHDVGHGMFSHAFENAMNLYLDKNSDVAPAALKDAVDHEKLSKRIVTESSVAVLLDSMEGPGFAAEVAAMIGKDKPNCIYTSIVSSQFDADRLDYAKRDPYFAGVSSGGIDLDWLISNLKIGGEAEERFFYVDSKAFISIEQFTVTLFQLYPTLYLHKRTRGIEYMFSKLMVRVFELISKNEERAAGISSDHPLVVFFKKPEDLASALSLDDSIFWGSLHMFQRADDSEVRMVADRIANRNIFPMHDVWRLAEKVAANSGDFQSLPAADRSARLHEVCGNVCTKLKADSGLWDESCYYDSYPRPIYKTKLFSGGHPQQINVQYGDGVSDISAVSPIVASAASFNIHRIYFSDEYAALGKRLESAIEMMLDQEFS